MDNIRLAVRRNSSKVFCYASFGQGKILMSRLHTSDSGGSTGLCFLDIPEAEQVNKTIHLTEETRRELIERSSIIFEFSSVKSIDSVMNMLLECRNALTGDATKKQTTPEQLETFMMYLQSHYRPVQDMWQNRLTEGELLSLTTVWKEFIRLT
jgi:hypothetical protein